MKHYCQLSSCLILAGRLLAFCNYVNQFLYGRVDLYVRRYPASRVASIFPSKIEGDYVRRVVWRPWCSFSLDFVYFPAKICDYLLICYWTRPIRTYISSSYIQRQYYSRLRSFTITDISLIRLAYTPVPPYPASSGFSRPDATGEKPWFLSRSVRPGETTARRVVPPGLSKVHVSV